MRIIHSFWFKPALDLYGTRFNGGFLTLRHFYYSWALSFHCVARKYTDVNLVTDLHGKELAEKFLGLSYASISADLENLSPSRNDFWNYGKFLAYKLQTKPFFHIDIDAFLWKPLPERMCTARLAVQSWELLPDHQRFYGELLAGMRGKLPRSLPCVQDAPAGNIRALNCGILGGQDLSFVHRYADCMMNIFDDPENSPGWDSIGRAELGEFCVSNCAIAVEQVGLAGLAQDAGLEPEVLIQNPQDGDVAMMEAGLTHLVGSGKSDPRYMSLLEERFARDLPELKARIDAEIA